MAQSLQKTKVKKVGNYLLIQPLEEGSIGKVWQGTYQDRSLSEVKLAIKEIKCQDLETSQNPQSQKQLIQNLVEIQKTIQHQNLVTQIDQFSSPNNIYLVSEFANGGNLKHFQQTRGGRVQEQEAKIVICQLAEGLKTLQVYQLVHRNLKPENILLSLEPNNTTLKISD